MRRRRSAKAVSNLSYALERASNALAHLLRRIKLTLPSSDQNFLSHPVLGLVNFTTLELMDHLRQQYGTFHATDFANLTLQLQQKMPAGSNFADNASKQRLILVNSPPTLNHYPNFSNASFSPPPSHHILPYNSGSWIVDRGFQDWSNVGRTRERSASKIFDTQASDLLSTPHSHTSSEASSIQQRQQIIDEIR